MRSRKVAPSIERQIWQENIVRDAEIIQVLSQSTNDLDFICAYLRTMVCPMFGIDRIGVYRVGNKNEGKLQVTFIFGVGDSLNKTIAVPQNLSDKKYVPTPTAGLGFDLYLRVGHYLFAVDDSKNKKVFFQYEIDMLIHIASAVERFLVDRVFAVSTKPNHHDRLTKLMNRCAAMKLMKKMGEVHPMIALGIGTICANRIIEFDLLSKRYAFEVFAAKVSQAVRKEGGEVARISEDELLIILPVPLISGLDADAFFEQLWTHIKKMKMTRRGVDLGIDKEAHLLCAFAWTPWNSGIETNYSPALGRAGRAIISAMDPPQVIMIGSPK